MNSSGVLLACAVVALATTARASPPPLASGTWSLGGEPLRWRAGRGFAGALSSIRFRGREYLDAADHGRELQGAVQFGAGECLNPTLAGASRDPPGESSSRLLSVRAGPAGYRASTRMAFWTRPGAPCTSGPGARGVALNRTAVSDLTYTQDMTPGYDGRRNAVRVEIAIASPHALPPASVEALTGYMPPDFDTFLVYDPQTGRFRRDPGLAARSGERDDPLVLSTADGRSAMGVVGLPTAVAEPRYAGFHSTTVGKWSLVYHETVPFAAGVHRYTCVWVIGTRREVEDSLAAVVGRRSVESALHWTLLAGAAAGALALGVALLVLRERRRRPPVPL